MKSYFLRDDYVESETNSRKREYVDLADLIYDGLVQPRKGVMAVKIKEIRVREDGWPFIVPDVPVEEWDDPFPTDPEYVEKCKPQVGGYWVMDEDEYWMSAEDFEARYVLAEES